MTTDVTIYEPLAVMPILDIQGAMVRRQAMVDFVKTILVEGVDFGTIPGTDKPTLLKPGAEKLTTFFGLSKRFEIMEKVEDWTGANHGSEPFFYYLYRARLYRSEVLIAESDGSASSWESKYRYRWVGEFDVPAHLDKAALTKRGGKITEFVFAIDKAETGGKWGKPSAYWKQFNDAIRDRTARPLKKKSNAGKEMDAWEIDSTVYRVPNPDPADVVNTIQKMAQKRALIAATLLAVNASEFFTQDMEDFVDAEYTMQAPTVASVQPTRTVTIERPAPAQPVTGKTYPGVVGPRLVVGANDGDEWEDLPSASNALPADRYEAGKAERNSGNGKTTPASARPEWHDKEDAIAWGFAQGCFDHANHAENAWNKIVTAVKAEHAPKIPTYAQVFDAWHADVMRRVVDHNAKIDAALDTQAAGEEAPKF